MRYLTYIGLCMIMMVAGSAQAQDERYISPPQGQIAYSAISEEGHSNIYLIDSDGTNNHAITIGDGEDVTPTWSWDGSMIIFNRRNSGNTFYTMDPDGQNIEQVFNQEGFSPMLSPDNSMMVFMLSSNIQIAPLGSDEPQLLTDFSFAYVPEWSPDGQTIAFVADDDATSETIWFMDADGSNQRAVYNSTSAISGVSWSPDGKSLAFSVLSGDSATLYVMDAGGSNIRGITNSTQYRATQPTWSADSQWIAFQWRPVTENMGSTLCVTNGEEQDQIYIINIHGENLQPVTQNGGCYPSWRPVND